MKKGWLISFNVITLLAWVLFLIHALVHGLKFNSQSLLLLNIAQGLAIFEILNAVIGIAGANWLLTTMQVGSRLLILVLVNWLPAERFMEIDLYDSVTGLALISVAWGITEIIRALYYLTGVVGKEIRGITWCRYSFFIVLYPMGVLGEFLIMFIFWEFRHFEFEVFNVSLTLVALSYFVFFPKLYMHMFKQRKKKL